ncbi:MAG: hypothetical protein ACKVGZ_09500, partial [Alphaproteobacteria bacterium]
GVINSAVQSALKEALPTEKVLGDGCDELLFSAPLSYQLSFIGLGTEEEIKPLVEKTQRLVAEVQQRLDLEGLDGITFAVGFQDALDAVERSFDIDATPEGFPDHIAQGAATVMVLRDGVAKVRIVLNAAYGVSLVGQEQKDNEVASYLLVAGLAQACTFSRIGKVLPEYFLEQVLTSDHDGILHCAVRKAIRAYRYARISAEIAAVELVEEEFTKYMVQAFGNAYAALETAKDEHSVNPDFPKLFEVSHAAARDMLISAARLIGYRHGVGEFEFTLSDESELGVVVASRQLVSWIDVFSKDLCRFWEGEAWARDDFYALNIHVERILWANGIILWREPDGHGTMIMVAPQS